MKKLVIVGAMVLGAMLVPGVAKAIDPDLYYGETEENKSQEEEKPQTPTVPGSSFTTLCDDDTVAQELKDAAGCPKSDEERNKTVFTVIEGLIQVVLGLFGLIAVGVMIYGGITYTTSTGDTAKTTKAKNIILYGLVGLVVAVLAYAIVILVSKSIGGA